MVFFHIGADRFESPVFPVGGTGPDQGALIGVGGEPAVFRKLAADLHIIRLGICQQGVKNLVQRVGSRALEADFRDMTREIMPARYWARKPKCHPAAFPLKKCGNGRPASRKADIDAQGRGNQLVSGVEKITGVIHRLSVIFIIFQGIDEGLGFLGGAQHAVLQLL